MQLYDVCVANAVAATTCSHCRINFGQELVQNTEADRGMCHFAVGVMSTSSQRVAVTLRIL